MHRQIGQLQRTAGWARATESARPYIGTPAAGVRLEELLTDVGLLQGETHVLALRADGAEHTAAHTVGELQHDLAAPVHIERHPDRVESRRLIRRVLNIPQPSLCVDVACEDVGVGPLVAGRSGDDAAVRVIQRAGVRP